MKDALNHSIRMLASQMNGCGIFVGAGAGNQVGALSDTELEQIVLVEADPDFTPVLERYSAHYEKVSVVCKAVYGEVECDRLVRTNIKKHNHLANVQDVSYPVGVVALDTLQVEALSIGELIDSSSAVGSQLAQPGNHLLILDVGRLSCELLNSLTQEQMEKFRLVLQIGGSSQKPSEMVLSTFNLLQSVFSDNDLTLFIRNDAIIDAKAALAVSEEHGLLLKAQVEALKDQQTKVINELSRTAEESEALSEGLENAQREIESLQNRYEEIVTQYQVVEQERDKALVGGEEQKLQIHRLSEDLEVVRNNAAEQREASKKEVERLQHRYEEIVTQYQVVEQERDKALVGGEEQKLQIHRLSEDLEVVRNNAAEQREASKKEVERLQQNCSKDLAESKEVINVLKSNLAESEKNFAAELSRVGAQLDLLKFMLRGSG